jgi:hypothetical protein
VPGRKALLTRRRRERKEISNVSAGAALAANFVLQHRAAGLLEMNMIGFQFPGINRVFGVIRG